MISLIFIAGTAIFAISSLFFFFGKKGGGMNTAFLVSFVTLASYILMWDGAFASQSASGEPIYWTRWIFYAISCSLLMIEIARVKGMTASGKVAELIFLNVLVMGGGALAALTVGLSKWIFFILASVAYLLQIAPLMKEKATKSKWVNLYILFGWSVFPVVFFLAPTGIEVFGSTIAMGLYLLLDIYTKILFNLQLKD